MYLSKRKIEALELAIEALESRPDVEEADDAINAILEILNSARVKRSSRKKSITNLKPTPRSEWINTGNGRGWWEPY